MVTLPVLSMVKRELQRKRISDSELARALKLHPSTVCGMLKSPGFQVQRLAELSELLNYNFFRELAGKLPYADPVYGDESKQSEVAGMQNRIKELEMEVGILRQTLRDLVKG